MNHPFQTKATPPTASEPLDTVRHFFAQIFRDELREWLPQIAAPAPMVALPCIGGMELAQEITGLSKARIYTLASERTLPSAKRGNKLRFSRADLLAWVAEGKRAQRPAVA